MKLAAAVAVAFAVFLLSAPAALAVHRLPHRPFARMTIEQKHDFLLRQIHHDLTALRWLRVHQTRQPAWTRPSVYRREVRWFSMSLTVATRNLARYRTRPARPTWSWPPHHLGWLCIHRSEAGSWADRDSGGNGHYGGLQMHPGWGYGTSEYASDDSQYVQEWAAERGFNASGRSSAWLEGQWGQTIGPCWGFFR